VTSIADTAEQQSRSTTRNTIQFSPRDRGYTGMDAGIMG